MAQLYLHIGTHKTGSTAIQDFMYTHRAEFAERGLVYPDLAMQGSGHHPFAWACGLRKKPRDEALLDSVCGHLDALFAGGADKVVCSSEEFEFIPDISPLKKISERFSPKVILYLRRQDDYLQAAYNQHVRMYELRYSGSVYQFAQKYQFLWKYDYLRLFNQWAEVFGAANIIVRPYGTEHVKKDIVDDFLTTIDPVLSEGMREKFGSNQVNVSLPVQALPYLSYANGLPLSPRQHQQLMMSLARYFADVPKAVLLRSEDAQNFLEKFEDSNTELFRRYTPYGEVPFSPIPTMLPWVNHEQIDVRLLISFLGEVLQTSTTN